MPHSVNVYFLGILLLFPSFPVFSTSVTDDVGTSLNLKSEAKRIITLAPHLAEQLYAIGAGHKIVGTVNYSDFPEAARDIPVIGGYDRFDLESILALKPDLVLGWTSGNSPEQISQLRRLQLPLFLLEPHTVNDIASSMERLGILTGHEKQAKAAAQKFIQGFDKLKQQYQSQRPVTLFYQLWHQPLMTVSNKQIINNILELCAGENIFKDLSGLTPVVSYESVIAADPEVIITTGMKNARPQSLAEWKKWPHLQAVKNNNIYAINPDIIHRATPRLLSGAQKICQILEQARHNSH